MNLIHEISNYKKLNNRLDNLEKKFNLLETKIDKIIELIEKNNKDCEKMSEHIDFVENVYENVKNPLGFICNKVNKLVTRNYTLTDKKINK